MHLVITLHGIRTFGGWQDRLRLILENAEDGIEVRSYRYNYFSALGFLFPPTRWIVTRRFRNELIRSCAELPWDRVDIVAHSFGTHIAAWAIRGLAADYRPAINTIIFAGSALKPSFSWADLIPRSVRRVINECGTHDDVLILSQFFSLFTGMAGRIGFIGMERDSFINRYYAFGHGGYFGDGSDDPDRFMREQWLPLLTSDAQIVRTPPRDAPTPVGGVVQFLIDNAEIVKILIYVVPLLAIILWINGLRQIAVARQLSAQSELVLQSNPEQAELAALLAAESMRRVPLLENDGAMRRAISMVPRSPSGILQAGLKRPYLWAFSPDGSFLAAGDRDGNIEMFQNGKMVRSFKLGGVESLSIGGTSLAVASNRRVELVDEKSGAEVATFEHDDVIGSMAFGVIGSMAFGSDGRHLLTLSGRQTVAERMVWSARIFDVAQKSEMSFPDEGSVDDATLSPSGRLVAFARMLGDGIDVFDLSSQMKIAAISDRGVRQVSDLAFSSDEKYLVVEGDDGFRKRVYDIKSGAGLDWLRKEADAVAFDPGSGYIAIGCDDGHVRVYRAVDHKELWDLDEGSRVDAVTFSHDGHFIATGAEDNTARVLDIKDGREVSRLQHDGRVFAVAFSPDDKYVATGNDDLTARVFRTESGSEVARFVPGPPPGHYHF